MSNKDPNPLVAASSSPRRERSAWSGRWTAPAASPIRQLRPARSGEKGPSKMEPVPALPAPGRQATPTRVSPGRWAQAGTRRTRPPHRRSGQRHQDAEDLLTSPSRSLLAGCSSFAPRMALWPSCGALVEFPNDHATGTCTKKSLSQTDPWTVSRAGAGARRIGSPAASGEHVRPWRRMRLPPRRRNGTERAGSPNWPSCGTVCGSPSSPAISRPGHGSGAVPCTPSRRACS